MYGTHVQIVFFVLVCGLLHVINLESRTSCVYVARTLKKYNYNSENIEKGGQVPVERRV